MDNLTKLGRALFGASFVAFGVQYFLYGRFAGGLPPAPPWTPGAPLTAYVLGALLITAGATIAASASSIAAAPKTRLFATLLGILLFVCVVAMFIATPSAIIHDGGARTRALEPLALAGAAWVLAGSLQLQPPNTRSLGLSADQLTTVGRFVFGACMVEFGAQHFMYAQFIATLVPAWLPLHISWTYFFGVAFIAAGISIVTGIQARLAAILLGAMFLLWVVVLHAPRVAASPHNGDEWSSLFVALAMCGSCFIIAGAAASKARATT